MKRLMFLLCISLNCMAGSDESDFALIHPEQISRCLKLTVASSLEVAITTNPYYLRGDFDADGNPDYAVAVRGIKTKRLGVLICNGNKRGFLLGADNPITPPFSDMPNDYFFAPNWEVFSRSETLALAKYKDAVPHPLPVIRGETIAMIWEDGIALVYWDGQRFKWAGVSR
jgi:hypothetical protein